MLKLIKVYRVSMYLINRRCLLNVSISLTNTGVDFIKGFAPCAHRLRLAPNFRASKKLLKSWAQGAKVGRNGTKPFMKSTPGNDRYAENCLLTLMTVSNMKDAGSPIRVRIRPRFSSIHRMNRFLIAELSMSQIAAISTWKRPSQRFQRSYHHDVIQTNETSI